VPPPIVAQELRLLDQVLAELDRVQERSGASEDALLQELDHLREALVDGSEAKDHGAILQQYERHSALLAQLRAGRDPRRVGRDSPYFAHLRLREGRDEWDLCLGRATFIKGGVSIVDWRNAPISRIFYRYRQGEEYEEEIAGRLRTGRVTTRRTLAIRDARLERVDAPEGVFTADPRAPDGWRIEEPRATRLAGGAGAALRVYDLGEGGGRRLGADEDGKRRRADKHLQDIAGLIDPAQFELITRPSSGVVVVRGTAGSGKTTVALHRIAYLAYDDESVDSAATIVAVFSPGLRNYVSHVLPALGVRRVRVATLHDWALDQCRRLFPMLPRAIRSHSPGGVYRLKVHPAMLAAIGQYVQKTPGPRTAKQVIDDWGSLLGNRGHLEEMLGREAPGAFTAEEIARAADWNRARYDEIGQWMQGDRDVVAEIDAEDATLLLRLWQVRIGPLSGPDGRPLLYRHVVIDEVQDFSPLEVRVLFDCLDEHRSMTLAGDTQQHIMQESGFTSWDDFFDRLGIEGTAVDTLRVSYRCTREIGDFAREVLGPLREDDEPPIATRSGPPVELFRFTDHGACVGFLADVLKDLLAKEDLASVAILTPSPVLSQLYADGLAASDVPQVRLIHEQEFTFTPGIEVTEIEQVKGLEYDYVVLVEVSTAHFVDTPAARRLLHVGATRAIHQLWLTSVATPSALVREALPPQGR
jgi:DNA helicase-2/ATP-dependent DNA helicase PcrA